VNSDTAISVAHLSKKFVIAQNKERYTALRDVITQKTKGIFKSSVKKNTEEFWALNDVSFDIKQGDRVGVIGRNGAGKSTLLKVLSRIYEPTKGRIEIHGRLNSLLEVGTGFHPELSGRENVFLNGAILGMSRNEIKSKFDEIVAFAEVEKFLETPVKRYSSGMYVRLAFAVAAHLDSEILIVDEVLAVGDSEFQKKCLSKMKDISTSSGRTILFVSHNMGAIRNFCNQAIYLEKGSIKNSGPTEAILPLYFGLNNQVNLNGLIIKSTPADESGEWVRGSMLNIEITWDKGRFEPGWHVDAVCYTLEGEKLFALQSHTFEKFESANAAYNGVVFQVENGGLINRDIRLDIGLRKSENESYSIVIENAMLLSPSNKFFTGHQVPDVLLVPNATCYPITA
jgi:ABC-type polysaccharide/polyol phosphate transport system ATPase subunit